MANEKIKSGLEYNGQPLEDLVAHVSDLNHLDSSVVLDSENLCSKIYDYYIPAINFNAKDLLNCASIKDPTGESLEVWGHKAICSDSYNIPYENVLLDPDLVFPNKASTILDICSNCVLQFDKDNAKLSLKYKYKEIEGENSTESTSSIDIDLANKSHQIILDIQAPGGPGGPGDDHNKAGQAMGTGGGGGGGSGAFIRLLIDLDIYNRDAISIYTDEFMFYMSNTSVGLIRPELIVDNTSGKDYVIQFSNNDVNFLEAPGLLISSGKAGTAAAYDINLEHYSGGLGGSCYFCPDDTAQYDLIPPAAWKFTSLEDIALEREVDPINGVYILSYIPGRAGGQGCRVWKDSDSGQVGKSAEELPANQYMFGNILKSVPSYPSGTVSGSTFKGMAGGGGGAPSIEGAYYFDGSFSNAYASPPVYPPIGAGGSGQEGYVGMENSSCYQRGGLGNIKLYTARTNISSVKIPIELLIPDVTINSNYVQPIYDDNNRQTGITIVLDIGTLKNIPKKFAFARIPKYLAPSVESIEIKPGFQKVAWPHPKPDSNNLDWATSFRLTSNGDIYALHECINERLPTGGWPYLRLNLTILEDGTIIKNE